MSTFNCPMVRRIDSSQVLGNLGEPARSLWQSKLASTTRDFKNKLRNNGASIRLTEPINQDLRIAHAACSLGVIMQRTTQTVTYRAMRVTQLRPSVSAKASGFIQSSTTVLLEGDYTGLHVVVSQNRGPEYRPPKTIVLIIGNPNKEPLIWETHM